MAVCFGIKERKDSREPQGIVRNKDGEKDTVTPAKPQAKVPAKSKATPVNENDEPAEPPMRELASKKDYQLGQALNLLKGLQIMQNKP